MTRRWPSNALGWHLYYAARFNKTGHLDAEYMAMLNFIFYLAFDNEVVPA